MPLTIQSPFMTTFTPYITPGIAIIFRDNAVMGSSRIRSLILDCFCSRQIPHVFASPEAFLPLS